MKLSREQRARVHAMFGGRCAYCGIVLPDKWHVDHVEAVYREWWKRTMAKYRHTVESGKIVKVKQDRTIGMLRPENDVIGNMFPACIPCNIDKTVYSLEDWRRCIERRVQVLRDNYSAYRHAERFGLVVQVKEKVEFYFETLAEEPTR